MTNFDDDEDPPHVSLEDELCDPLVRLSEVKRILLASDLLPRSQVPMIIEKIRDETVGGVFNLGTDKDLEDEYPLSFGDFND